MSSALPTTGAGGTTTPPDAYDRLQPEAASQAQICELATRYQSTADGSAVVPARHGAGRASD